MNNIVKSIIDSEIKYLSVHEHRARLVAQMRGRNVQFKDVEKFLLKEARREGYYSDESHLERAKKENLAWFVYLSRFITYVKKTFNNDWSEKVNIDGKYVGKTKDKKTVTKISEKRAEKMLEVPDNVEALTTALINSGKMVINVTSITEGQVEALLEEERNLQVILRTLRDMGYTIS